MSGVNATNTEPWTILRLLQWTTEHLKKAGSLSPRLDAEVLLAHARNCQRIELYTAYSEEPSEEIKTRFRELIKRRAAGEPVAYLVGKKEFYSLSFRVGPGCLIPRGETEHIVIECLDRAKLMCDSESNRPVAIADVCTGSGCIAVAVAKHLTNANLVAIDISDEALSIARANVEMHELSDRIELRRGDLLSSIEDGSLDFVLSNPPYISQAEFTALDKTIREHEPRIALVSGPEGTEVIQRLIEQASKKLKPKSWLICELSPMIAHSVVELLQTGSLWENVNLIKDLAGQKRVVTAQTRS